MNSWLGLLLVVVILAGIIGAGVIVIKYPPPSASSCGEGIHVTHNGQAIVNLAIKQLGSASSTWGSTNSTGYFILSFCQPVGTIVTFQATDYGFQLEPHQIVEAAI